jgi:hypothetical protein
MSATTADNNTVASDGAGVEQPPKTPPDAAKHPPGPFAPWASSGWDIVIAIASVLLLDKVTGVCEIAGQQNI